MPKSTIVNSLKEALSEIDPNSTNDGDARHIEMIAEEFCKVAFGGQAVMRDKIEALKFMGEILRQDIADGMGITQMEDLIIERGAVGYTWARDVEPDIKITVGSRVACLYDSKVYMAGKVVQFKHSPETHIVEDQLTSELYEWQISEVRHLSISEYIAWINHMNVAVQGEGMVLPQGHVERLRALHG